MATSPSEADAAGRDAPAVLLSVDRGVATLVLNRPEARNAISDGMRVGLDRALADIKADAGQTIKALVITGAAGHFCAGGDVKAQNARAQQSEPRTATQARQRMRNDHARILDLSAIELPVIAAVDGAAAGAGFSLALAADLIVASERAYFVQSFGRLGLVPDWNSMYLLPRLIGLQRAKELVFSARRVSAAEALAMGLVHAVHPHEQLLAQAQRMARRYTHASTTAIGLAKTIMNQSQHLDNRAALEMEAMAQAVARDTAFHREAVGRFVAKQPALFDWEQLQAEDRGDAMTSAAPAGGEA